MEGGSEEFGITVVLLRSAHPPRSSLSVPPTTSTTDNDTDAPIAKTHATASSAQKKEKKKGTL